ncbi:hypothetical protein HNV11_00700 [Spirosoma taeanense]|uniref:Uncharacterized protein n=1 Tax=Spirosoma taeanense TaxID=2735870 RepID=A0A6M5Y4G9_9BACT|nr:hypothetical protein [Spirosoma taeanense]QJW87993.1 hypothetical protein HNV11_00700 [Spirosoma taeanense]
MANTPFIRARVAGVSVPSDLDINGFEAGARTAQNYNFRTERINQARQLIRESLVKIKTTQLNTSSHRLTQWLSEALGYTLTNGELITAMIGEEFDYYRSGPNCYFNVSQKSIRLLRARSLRKSVTSSPAQDTNRSLNSLINRVAVY